MRRREELKLMQDEPQGNSQGLVVPVLIELHPSLDSVLDAQNTLHTSFTQALMLEMTELMDTLGIPGKPTLQIMPLPEGLISSNRLLRVSVNGCVCRFPDELLQRAHSYVHGVQINPEAKPALILAWLCELSKEESERADLKNKCLVEFLSLTCLEIVKRQPAVLLGLAQVASYSVDLPNPTGTLKLRPDIWPPEPEWLHPILSKVLQFNLSLKDKLIIARVLARANGRSQEDVVEDLVDVLRSDVIEIHISREYLQQLSGLGSGFGLLTGWRTSLFQELGLRYPEFHFVRLEAAKPYSITCKINQLTLLPLIGLQMDQCFAIRTASYLQNPQIQARPAIDPIWGLEGYLINATEQDVAKGAGLMIHNPVEYLADCLAAYLKESSQCFVYRKEVQNQLILLGKTYPALLKTVQESVSVEQITRVVRALVSEEISVSNLRFILERMLDYNYLFTDSDNFMSYEDRLPIQKQSGNDKFDYPVNIASFIRIGLKGFISRKVSNGQETLDAFNIRSDFVKNFLAHQPSAIEYDMFLEDVRSNINALSSATSLILITTIGMRPLLRELIASEFPRLPVLAYEERTPDLKLNQLQFKSIAMLKKQ
jgi:hypothetical protein